MGTIENNAFRVDDCQKCLNNIDDAYFCSSTDDHLVADEDMQFESGYCCGEFQQYTDKWWEAWIGLEEEEGGNSTANATAEGAKNQTTEI